MPIGKSTNKNKELGDRGEALTQQMFGLAPTSGSGCGRFDKQDSKNDFLRVETKTTSKDHYLLNIDKFELWRQQAARARSQFFLHLIPEISGELDWDQSLVVITEAYFTALTPDINKVAWSHNFVEKSYRVKFGARWEDLYFGEMPLQSIDRLTIHDGRSLVVLKAPYFKELLDGST